MEVPAELLATLPALFTVLALLLAWLLLRRGAAPKPAPPAETTGTPTPPSPCAPEPAGPGEPEGPEEPGEPAAAPAQAEDLMAEAKKEEEPDSDGDKGPPSAEPEDEDGEAFSFKYSPGQLRGNQYKKMMTKEELEEEQRVQKEQLAAIFKLMKDNKETFGEMSDGDVQEQLRLYDM
ncbi:matrix-remodeling-associated protein 7 isoform X1 [Heterocephalus glaber]|uniref:Matrix-remodeling-associated protein 7 isoform X1 n=2 Tax=Heterocephalus glaber TaxID=10181 RepID=A0AAX6PXY2_HETGA|nr:matrix-remodeling-associated protein 7 isoform X1 [Heterocephalus glaber]